MIEFDLTDNDYRNLSLGLGLPIKSKCNNYTISSMSVRLDVYFLDGSKLDRLTLTVRDEERKIKHETSFQSTKGFNKDIINELIKDLSLSAERSIGSSFSDGNNIF